MPVSRSILRLEQIVQSAISSIGSIESMLHEKFRILGCVAHCKVEDWRLVRIQSRFDLHRQMFDF